MPSRPPANAGSTITEIVPSLIQPNAGSTITEIFPGDKCIAGDRETKVEGAAYTGRDAVYSRVEQEANWQVLPGIVAIEHVALHTVRCSFALLPSHPPALSLSRLRTLPFVLQVPHLNPGVLSLLDFKSSKFNITFRKVTHHHTPSPHLPEFPSHTTTRNPIPSHPIPPFPSPALPTPPFLFPSHSTHLLPSHPISSHHSPIHPILGTSSPSHPSPS